MGLLGGSGGGDDRLQVGMAVFALVISLTVSLMLPIVAPAYDTSTGYTYADIFAEKSSLEAYTGESMTNMTPWKLTGVYTPWVLGDDVNNIDDETGWAYGESVTYNQIGQTSKIKLDPNNKSDTPLATTSYKDVPITTTENVWWMYGLTGNLSVLGFIGASLGLDTTEQVTRYQDVNSWVYTGYRYEFDPMLKIDYSDPDGASYSKASQSDAKLSIVWYKGLYGQGLSGGLILYNNSTNGIVANITQEDILASYNSASNYSTRYAFDFEGVQVYLNLRFDMDVIAGSYNLTDAFNEGKWTMAITALSMDNFMDLSGSNSLSNSAANIIDTYIKIYTLSFPTLDFMWSMVLWIICVLPIQLTVLMFLSRFGIAGIAVGVLGSAILAAFGLAGA